MLLSIPGDIAVTKEDVAADNTVAQLASGRSELVGLALWLISQRCKVQAWVVWHALKGKPQLYENNPSFFCRGMLYTYRPQAPLLIILKMLSQLSM